MNKIYGLRYFCMLIIIDCFVHSKSTSFYINGILLYLAPLRLWYPMKHFNILLSLPTRSVKVAVSHFKCVLLYLIYSNYQWSQIVDTQWLCIHTSQCLPALLLISFWAHEVTYELCDQCSHFQDNTTTMHLMIDESPFSDYHANFSE